MMLHFFSLRSFFLCVLFLAGSAPGLSFGSGAWDRSNDPFTLGSNQNTRLSDLPASGRVAEDRMPWSDTYWPRNRGGIAYRWNSKDPAFRWINPKRGAGNHAIWRIHSPSLNELHGMSEDQIAELSPAEKFDIYRGYYDYPLTREVLKSTKPDAPYWGGICHGWSAAAINLREPAPVTVVNRDGVRIPFGSSDVKGLLSYFYAGLNSDGQVGLKCSFNLRIFSPARATPACADVNAASFHILMANFIGVQKRALIMDMDPGSEIWNNPVFAYESRIEGQTGPSSKSASGTARRVKVVTTIHYADDDEESPPKWNAVLGTADFKQDQAEYNYWLDLDSSGRIIGGEWTGAWWLRPDFIWAKSPEGFSGGFEALADIYRPASRMRGASYSSMPDFGLKNILTLPFSGSDGEGSLEARSVMAELPSFTSGPSYDRMPRADYMPNFDENMPGNR